MLRECSKRGHQTSAMVGTIFHRSHLPLLTWFHAIWLVSRPEGGMTARSLQEGLGLSNYRIASNLHSKLRQVLVKAYKNKLEGGVHVGETTIDVGRHFSETSRRQGIGKVPVIVAVAVGTNETLHVRIKRLTNPRPLARRQFITDSLEPGSTIFSLRDERYEFLKEMDGFMVEFEDYESKKLLWIDEAAIRLKKRLKQLRPGAITSMRALDFCLDKFVLQDNINAHPNIYYKAVSRKTFHALLKCAVRTPPSPV